jgi:selenocysteine-specific elongation factor
VLQGHGVVVTGTALSGEIKTGDRVRCLPGDQIYRVRSLQVHGHSVETAGWGQRVALNLTGPERADVERGHVICHEKLTLTSDRFDAHLEVRPAASKGIKNHQRVRVHLGTTERLGKVILLGAKDKAEPKTAVYCQISLAEPVMTLRGDHFIIRDETARRTLAGGRVIHPWARRHKRNEPDLEARLTFLHSGDLTRLTEAFLAESPEFAMPIESIHQFLNLGEEETRNRVEKMEGLRAFNAEGEKIYTTEPKWQDVKTRLVKALKDFHTSHPLLPGMEMEELRSKLPYGLSPKIFRVIIDRLLSENAVAKEGNLLRLPTHKIRLGGAEQSLMEKIKKILAEQPMAPPDLKEMERHLGVSRNRLNEVIRLLERDGSIARVSTDLYFLSSCVDKVRSVLYTFLSEKGEITAAAFRDLLGSSRKYTIALLEYFDREGTTIRVGDIRRLKSNTLAGAGKQDASVK